MLRPALAVAQRVPTEAWYEDEFEFDLGPEYGVAGPTDDRFQIRNQPRHPSTRLFPFNTICLLEGVSSTGQEKWGTGTLIAPRVVLTARHVLLYRPPDAPAGTPCGSSTTTNGPLASITVTPGADFSAAPARQRTARPISITASSANIFVDTHLDYGIIILPRAFTSPNRFMLLQSRSVVNTQTLLTIAGYPCDKQRGTLWGHSERIPVGGVSATHLRYTIDTCPGHSGSPIWLLGDRGVRILLGVHTGGVNNCQNDPAGTCEATGAPVTPSGAVQNCGVRITCDVIDNIRRWCRAARVRPPNVDARAYQMNCGRPLR